MLPFILTISFLLHIILFTAIFFLFRQIQSLKQDHTKEITDLFDQYLHEIKAENMRLETEVAKNLTSKKPEKTFQEKSQTPLPEKEFEENAYISQVDLISDHYEPTLEAQILQLHHQGYSEEEIARKLNSGKTEVALVVKFSNQNRT